MGDSNKAACSKTTYRVGNSVQIMSREELEFILENKLPACRKVIKYFSFRMLLYLGCYARVIDVIKDTSGGEYYRLDIDRGENAWDRQLLRVDQR